MEKSIQVGNIVIRRSNVLEKEEKDQISRLTAVCNRADGTCNELFLTNEFNVYPEMPCFFRAYVENGSTELGLAGILIIYGDQEKMAEISAYVLPEQRGKGVFHALFHNHSLLFLTVNSCQDPYPLCPSKDVRRPEIPPKRFKKSHTHPYRYTVRTKRACRKGACVTVTRRV